ncbi:carbonic anhydrase [Nonomuraea angiospora]
MRNADVRPVAGDGPDVSRAVQAHVLAELERLGEYPPVATRLADGRLSLRGWFYEVHTGSVLAYRPDTGVFLPL